MQRPYALPLLIRLSSNKWFHRETINTLPTFINRVIIQWSNNPERRREAENNWRIYREERTKVSRRYKWRC